MDKPKHFVISESRTRFTIENAKAGDFDNFHTHIRKRKSKKHGDKTCRLLIELICNKQVPKSSYLRTSAKRISRDEEYIATIEHKEEKDRKKPITKWRCA